MKVEKEQGGEAEQKQVREKGERKREAGSGLQSVHDDAAGPPVQHKETPFDQALHEPITPHSLRKQTMTYMSTSRL